MSDPSLLYLTLSNARIAKRWLRETLANQYPDTLNLPFELLSKIDKSGNSQMELAAKLHCSKQEASRIIQKAAKDGWVELAPDPNDKRAKRVTLSAKAKAALAEGQSFYKGLEKELFSDLSDAEIQQMQAAARTLSKVLKQQLEKDKTPG